MWPLPITDAALGHLKGMTSLQYLVIRGTKFTDRGINTFKIARPDVKAER